MGTRGVPQPMPGRLCPVLKQHSESGHGRLFHLEAWLSCGVAKTRPHATAHSGMIVSMCSDELVRQVPPTDRVLASALTVWCQTT